MKNPGGTILVTGGAYYIGSYATRHLLDQGCSIIVLDNLGKGYVDAVPDGLLVQGDIGDAALLNRPSGGNPGLRSKLPGAPGATGSNKKVMKVLYSRLGVSLLTALCCRAGGRALPGALHA